VIVEPWMTPFLALVHAMTRNGLVRKLSPKFDALAVMIHYEKETYFPWLEHPKLILDLLDQNFKPEQRFFRLGKMHFVGRKP
jgi:hypothetical protein